jgi:hypothetical protein
LGLKSCVSTFDIATIKENNGKCQKCVVTSYKWHSVPTIDERDWRVNDYLQAAAGYNASITMVVSEDMRCWEVDFDCTYCIVIYVILQVAYKKMDNQAENACFSFKSEVEIEGQFESRCNVSEYFIKEEHCGTDLLTLVNDLTDQVLYFLTFDIILTKDVDEAFTMFNFVFALYRAYSNLIKIYFFRVIPLCFQL